MADVGSHALAKRRVEPDDVSFPVFLDFVFVSLFSL